MMKISRRLFTYGSLTTTTAWLASCGDKVGQNVEKVEKEAESAGQKVEQTGPAVEQFVKFVEGLDPYVYGFPLVMMDVTKQITTAVSKAGDYGAPINQFARIPTFVDPDFKNVVRISRNSLWSYGFVDLDQEPFVYTQPDTQGRYIVMQALNMWTDDFGSAGSRNTGSEAGNFLIAGPKWTGTTPADVKAIFKSSTRYAWVLVQIAADDAKEFPEINALQDKLQLIPLSSWGKPYTPPSDVPIDPNVDLTLTPFDTVRLMTGETFFKRLALLMEDNPPYPEDGPMLEKLKRIGIEPGKAFDTEKINQAKEKGLDKIPGELWAKLAAGPYGAPTVNGWQNPLNLGRYGTDYDTRALIAWLGLGALTSDDALYPSAFVDGDGNILEGDRQYVIRFNQGELPPSESGVWSISQYRENFYVRNAIERYAIKSGMPLTFNADGSLDVYIQAKSPGADKEANWLPSPPSQPFNLTMRVY